LLSNIYSLGIPNQHWHLYQRINADGRLKNQIDRLPHAEKARTIRNRDRISPSMTTLTRYRTRR
jgi:hypothetical protein